jgi:hypothetical protein
MLVGHGLHPAACSKPGIPQVREKGGIAIGMREVRYLLWFFGRFVTSCGSKGTALRQVALQRNQTRWGDRYFQSDSSANGVGRHAFTNFKRRHA